MSSSHSSLTTAQSNSALISVDSLEQLAIQRIRAEADSEAESILHSVTYGILLPGGTGHGIEALRKAISDGLFARGVALYRMEREKEALASQREFAIKEVFAWRDRADKLDSKIESMRVLQENLQKRLSDLESGIQKRVTDAVDAALARRDENLEAGLVAQQKID